uniref:Uncharacterized protein LOC114344940 n=1 Tax=Diabrotica virgifera virgifera TaxID=50390 RepID=A0A6P7GZI3_DIAVI
MEKFIELVRQYPIIYNLSHEEYKNIRKKDKVWSKIGEEIGENSDELKKKWRNLRDTYAKYIRTSKTKTGQAVNSTKKWIWADQMEAFKPFLSFAKTTSNVSDVRIPEYTELTNVESFENEIGRAQSSSSQNTQSNNSGTSNTDIIQEHRTPISFRQKASFDAIDQLFLAHTFAIKTFSPRRQIETKMKIAQVIMEQELLQLDECSTNQSRSASADTYPNVSSVETYFTEINEENGFTNLTNKEDYVSSQSASLLDLSSASNYLHSSVT